MGLGETFTHIFGDNIDVSMPDGSHETFRPNLLDSGYTGSSGSRIEKHSSDKGFDVISSDGTREKFSPSDSGFSSNHGTKIYGNPFTENTSFSTIDPGIEQIQGGAAMVLGLILAAMSIFFLIFLNPLTFFLVLLCALTVAARIFLCARYRSTLPFYCIMPFTLLIWKFLGDVIWTQNGGNWLILFGFFFLSLALLTTFYIDAGEEFGAFFFGFGGMVAMFFSSAYEPYFAAARFAVFFAMILIASCVGGYHAWKKEKK